MAMPEDSRPPYPLHSVGLQSLWPHDTRWLAGLTITVVTEGQGQQECQASAKGPRLRLGFPGKDLGWRTGWSPALPPSTL